MSRLRGDAYLRQMADEPCVNPATGERAPLWKEFPVALQCLKDDDNTLAKMAGWIIPRALAWSGREGDDPVIDSLIALYGKGIIPEIMASQGIQQNGELPF